MARTLIISAPRSGTTFIAEVLQAVGLDIPHECHGEDGAVGWEYAVDRERTNWGGKRSDRPFGAAFHQTREPLATITSLQTTWDCTWDWIGESLPLPDDLLRRCMATYVGWHRLCDGVAPQQYRVEDVRNGTKTWVRLCEWLGLPAGTRCPDVPADTNTREHSTLTWADLANADWALAGEVRLAASHYGYARGEG